MIPWYKHPRRKLTFAEKKEARSTLEEEERRRRRKHFVPCSKTMLRALQPEEDVPLAKRVFVPVFPGFRPVLDLDGLDAEQQNLLFGVED